MTLVYRAGIPLPSLFVTTQGTKLAPRLNSNREPPSEQAVLLFPRDALETLYPWHLGYEVAGAEAVPWPLRGLGRGRPRYSP